MGRVSRRLGRATFALTAMALQAQPGPAQPPVWRLSATPLLILGSDDNPETEFHQIAGVLRLASGILRVAESICTGSSSDRRLTG